MERAAMMDRSRELKRRVSLLSRASGIAAAVVFVFLTAFLAASGMFSSDKFGAYYNGAPVSEDFVLAELKATDYVAHGISLARQTIVEEINTVVAEASVELELYGRSATVTVDGGMILHYDKLQKNYVEGGSTLPFSGKTKIVWALPQGESGTYELTVKGEDGTYKLRAEYDAQGSKLSFKKN